MISKNKLKRLIAEETEAVLLQRRVMKLFEEQEDAQGDAISAAQDANAKKEIERIMEFMFKDERLGPALDKIKQKKEYLGQFFALMFSMMDLNTMADISPVLSVVKNRIQGAQSDDGTAPESGQPVEGE